jgi:lipopolysaccharide transport system permease protein
VSTPIATPIVSKRAAEPAEGLEPVETVIAPERGWRLVDLGELWRFRELIALLALRDVKVRYKQTVLGAAWAVLQPAMMMVVFTIFFSRMAGISAGDVPYPLFAFAGLRPWTLFATAITSAAQSVIGSERLITKIYFPRLAIPLAAVGASAVDFGIATGLLLLMMIYYGVAPSAGLLLAPLIALVILLGALGVGTLLAALTVSFRDFKYVIAFLVQLWLFATPSVYMKTPALSLSAGGPTPLSMKVFLALNPLTSLIAAFRASMLGTPIDWAGLGLSTALVLLACAVGFLYFRKVEDGFADII